MGGASPLRARNDLAQLVVDLLGIIGARQSEALGDTEDMGIDREGGDAKRVAEHHVGGLASDAR